MRIEFTLLVASIALGFVHITIQIMAATKIRGEKWNVGSRDEKMPELTGFAGRAERALENFKETFPFFAAAVLIAGIAGELDELSVAGAWAYFIARSLYLPIYLAGVPVVRTIVWMISAVGIGLVLASLYL